MLLYILPSKLLEIAKNMSSQLDSFNQWACEHIERELSNFLDQNPELQYICKSANGYLYMPKLEKEYYLSFDGYWLLQCKDQQEVIVLLRTWYIKREYNNE